MTRSLTRPDSGLGPGRGPDYPFLRPVSGAPGPGQSQEVASAVARMGASERAEAVEFLAAKARWPGVAGRVTAAERELGEMSQAERVYLEIEMATKRGSSHTADYDPLAWGRS